MKIDSLTSFLITCGLLELYEKLSPELQQKIKQIFNLHHGTIGALIEILGILKGDPRLMVAGGVLMYHDRNDAPLWKKDIGRIINSAIQKLKENFEQSKQQSYITQTRYYLPDRF